MVNNRLEGLMINRLLVLIQITLVPAYFIYFSIRWRDQISEIFVDFSIPYIIDTLPAWLVWFEINLAIPIFFSLPWVLISIIRATRIADAYELMGRALGKVRIDQKLFYGLNAAFTLIFLIFPFFSPIITIIGIFWLVRILLRKAIIGRWWLIWFLPAILLATPPILIAYAFYSNYLILFDQILTVWINAIPALFGIGLSLAIGISLGNFLHFLFEGSVKYGGYEQIPHGFILIFKMFIFSAMVLVYFNTDPPTIVNITNYVAVGFGFLEIVLRKVRDLPTEGDWASGIVMVIAFSVVNIIINLLQRFEIVTQIIQTLVIVLSALIFFGLFAISYYYADDEELYQ